MRCSVCGVDHPIEEIEPAFSRPDAYVALSADNTATAASGSRASAAALPERLTW